ncbi:MAG TPA: cytochrome P450 [Thermoanaerobaculia bacterium]|nr:cytochrome P450 [Thermoanaerobaculia bacterium]
MEGPPGPRGHRLLGSLLDVRQDKLRFVSRATRDHGDIVLFRMGPARRLYLLSHPEPIHHVLHDNPGGYVKGIGLEQARILLGEGILTSEGDLWSGQRQNLLHLFVQDRLAGYAGVIAQAAERMTERWRASAESGEPVEVAGETVRLALEVLGGTLLGADLNGLGARLTPALDEVVRWSMRRMTAVLPLPVSVPTPANLRCRRAVRELEQVADEILARGGGNGFLSALGESDPERLRQEILSLVLAGHETTATTLSWCCHLLATHPEIQQNLREEVVRALPADLPRLPYARMVVEEALRLYPPVWMITRRAVAEDRIGGYSIPAGSDILISVYTLHRHPDFWEAPEEFRPERFATRPSQAYMPFGTGPRACLGRGFAFLEAILTLSLIVRSFELSPVPGKPPEAEPLLTLRPRNGLFLRLRSIEN